MKDLVRVFKACSDETRIRILDLLIERECCVCEVMQVLAISQTRASRNLAQLYDAGLLECRREGLWTIYYLAPEIEGDFRDLLITAVKQALSHDKQVATDLKSLRNRGRLCPVT
ncbi:MAG: ArsR/SmtB family transcription factor [Dehalogenimonas sp.]